MANAKLVRRGLAAAVVGGAVIGSCYFFLAKTTEPEIPSCPACQFKHQPISGRARITGEFSTVDTSIWVDSRVALPSGTTIPIALPTGGSYDQTIGGVGSKPASANMQFQYKTSGGDLRWATKTLNLPVQ